MTRFSLGTLTLALAVLGFMSAASAQGLEQDDDTLEWLDDYDEAIALAKETGKPLFLEFRCGP